MMLTWDQTEYSEGVDHGVLYLEEGVGVAWNGLTSVNEELDDPAASYFIDGVKYLQTILPSDFAVTVTAFTYPDEFLDYETGKMFGFSYRIGAKIHVIFNVMAWLKEMSYQTINDQPNISEFSWLFTGAPDYVEGFRPTAHAVINVEMLSAVQLAALNSILYGSEENESRLPSLSELNTFLAHWNRITVTDNFDGSWTAVTYHDNVITFSDPTTFEIDGIDGYYIDAYTYVISTTEEP